MAKPQKIRANLTALDRAKLRVESMCDLETISRWARGDAVREATEVRLEKAASKLEIEMLT